MKILILILFCSNFAKANVNIVNSSKSKKVILTHPYLKSKIEKSKSFEMLSYDDFSLRVRKLFEDYSPSLPFAMQADFNQDKIKDVVVLVKYKKKNKGLVLAAVSKGKDKYKLHKVMEFDLFSLKDINLNRSKKDKDEHLLTYLLDQSPKKIENKPIVFETYLDKQKVFEFKKNKFVEVSKN